MSICSVFTERDLHKVVDVREGFVEQSYLGPDYASAAEESMADNEMRAGLPEPLDLSAIVPPGVTVDVRRVEVVVPSGDESFGEVAASKRKRRQLLPPSPQLPRQSAPWPQQRSSGKMGERKRMNGGEREQGRMSWRSWRRRRACRASPGDKRHRFRWGWHGEGGRRTAYHRRHRSQHQLRQSEVVDGVNV